ncbi:C1QB protein, partial [Rhinopomastus cyanomelas]|nr:C1QB protein [Rhinopomastus cyanomelas]
GISRSPGQPGSNGRDGDAGPKGEQEAMGETGDPGVPGYPGKIGPSGSRVPSGLTGIPGLPSPQGDPGDYQTMARAAFSAAQSLGAYPHQDQPICFDRVITDKGGHYENHYGHLNFLLLLLGTYYFTYHVT